MAKELEAELNKEMFNLNYDSLVCEAIGFRFSDFIKDLSNIDDMNHGQLRSHIERINNDKLRFQNQLNKKYDEQYFFFNNCYNVQRYINYLKTIWEPTDIKFLVKYYSYYYDKLINKLTLVYEGLKSEANERNKKHIKEHGAEMILCDCQFFIARKNLARHKTTKKHLDNLCQNIII